MHFEKVIKMDKKLIKCCIIFKEKDSHIIFKLREQNEKSNAGFNFEPKIFTYDELRHQKKVLHVKVKGSKNSHFEDIWIFLPDSSAGLFIFIIFITNYYTGD